MESDIGGDGRPSGHPAASSAAAVPSRNAWEAHADGTASGPGLGGRGAVLCIGELLWDSLPAGLFLGGAPFNVACHLHAFGVRAEMGTRVGADRLGQEALERLRGYGVSTDLVQIDTEVPTGFSKVELDYEGVPKYEIVAPAAWDAIEASSELRQHAAGARAIVFGSLAQRNAVTRATINEICRGSALKVFDVNLRPPYDDPQCVRESLGHANIVKVNGDELQRLRSWFDLPESLGDAIAALAEKFRCQVVCVTFGKDGSALWRRGQLVEHPGYKVDVKDTVGAGDAFLAALLVGLFEGHDDLLLLKRANLVGAYLATHTGALPAYREDAIMDIAGADSSLALDLIAGINSARFAS